MDDALLQQIRTLLQSLQALELEIADDSHLHAGHAGARDGGRHFRLRIVSAAFEGLSAVGRHRLVYDCLSDLMPRPIHALAMRLLSPQDAALAAGPSTPRE
jgi:BolA family transcriptional regulator, general stress-responsive regulator